MECVQGEMTHFKGRQLSKLLCLPSEKRSTLKGKNLLPFAPSGSKFLPSSLQKEIYVQGSQQEVIKVVSLFKNGAKSF